MKVALFSRLQRASGRCKEAAAADANYLPEPDTEGKFLRRLSPVRRLQRNEGIMQFAMPNGSGTAIIRLPCIGEAVIF